MASYSKNEVILVKHPFSDLSSAKVRPAVIVSTAHSSKDVLIVPLTSKTASLLAGEFVLADWQQAGLNVESDRETRPVHSSAKSHCQNYRKVICPRSGSVRKFGSWLARFELNIPNHDAPHFCRSV